MEEYVEKKQIRKKQAAQTTCQRKNKSSATQAIQLVKAHKTKAEGSKKSITEYTFLDEQTGKSQQGKAPPEAAVTVAVHNKNFGHTFIIIETTVPKPSIRMFHFCTKIGSDGKTDPRNQSKKVIKGTGIFEEIKKGEHGAGKDPKEFIEKLDLLCNQISIDHNKAKAIIKKCDSLVKEKKPTFSLIGGNFGLGDNCFSKVYYILQTCGIKVSTSTYLLSFLTPRLAIGYGGGFIDQVPPHDE